MRIEKHQQNNGKGRGKLTFNPTPELMAAFEASLRLLSVPGTNVNSNRTVGETARRAGVEATRTRLRANYKRNKRRNVGEMHTYVASKERQDPVTGEPVITETTDVGPNGSGAMSGRDPLLGTMFDLYTGAKAWDTGTKLLLWGAGKYMPSTILGLWGRRAIIDDVANRSFNPGGWGQLAARPVANVGSKNLFRTKVYKGGEITDPYSNFVTTDPLYAANYGKVTPYIFESKSIARAKEPMMGYRDPVSLDMFIYNNTKRNPNATAIIGHDAVTGEFTPSKGIEILNLNPENLYPIKTSEPLTSLKFFERRPSRISERERLGIPKGETYYTPELNKTFLKQINDFAEKYGYPALEDSEYSSELLNSYARALIDRHNKFYRGVFLPVGEDLDLIKKTLGDKATNELMLLHVATHSRGEGMSPELYITPTTNAFSYGANGRTAIISRPYKLGKDRTKWFDEGDFNIVETGTVNPKSYNDFLGIVYPWDSPRFLVYDHFLGGKTIPEYYRYLTPKEIIEGDGYYEYIPNPRIQNELVAINYPMIFRQWVENPTLETLSRKTPDVPWQLSEITVRKQGGKLT